MTKSPGRLLMSIAIFCTVFMLRIAHAEQAQMPVTAPNKLFIELPVVDRAALIEKIVALRDHLMQLQQSLVQSVSDRELDSGDAIITAIVPGGLLYGSYKKARYEQAKNELAQVNADIEDTSSDLQAMQAMAEPVIVARLP